MSRHQLQPTCAATDMWAKVLRLASAASYAPTFAPNSSPAWATLGLCHRTSTGLGHGTELLDHGFAHLGGDLCFGNAQRHGVLPGGVLVRHEDTAERRNVTTRGRCDPRAS